MNLPVGTSLYDILDIAPDAGTEDIKTAFRKLAMQFHPDRHGGSAEAAARFTLVHNAYAILVDPAARSEYDALFRSRSPGNSHSNAPPRVRVIGPATETLVFDHLNFVLWEIEDLLRGQVTGESEIVAAMLTFIDRWVLGPAGYPDYFFAARGMKSPRSSFLTARSESARRSSTHLPYANLSDYFYDVRKRTDRFLQRSRLTDLLSPVEGTSVRLVDCILEAHNYCVHCLTSLRGSSCRSLEDLPPFHHSNACFEG